MLFADLSGYTAWCSAHDPEEVHILVRPLMNALRRTCEDLDGVVTAIEGDGLMAVFGARGGDETAPRKALVAASRLQGLVAERRAAFGDGLPGLRVGINAGEVLVAPSWERGGFSVSGDAVNVARRVCEHAEVGGVLAHEVLRELVPSDGAWGDSHPITVKGRTDPVPVCALQWAGAQSQLSAPRGLSQTPFAGRETLLLEVSDAVAAGRVVLIGEPGIGKSRLMAHWATTRAAGPVFTIRCPAFSVDGYLAPLADLARSLLDGHAGDVLHRRLRRLAGDEVDSLEADSEDELLRALLEAMGTAISQGPVTLLVDDFDLASDPVRRVVEAALGAAVLATSRTSVKDAGWQELRVDALAGDEVDALTVSLLPGCDEQLQEVLRARSGGNPLFVEQCIRLLLEEGLVTSEPTGYRLAERADLRSVPTAMRLFVSSRLEGLPALERQLLGAASVMGDIVDTDVLRYLMGAECSDVVDQLVERRLLRWELGRQPGRPELRFAHALVRDVAYEAQLRSQRVAHHLAAAEWYAVLPVASVLEAEARHLEAAVALGNADCDLVRRTVGSMVLHARSITEERPGETHDVLRRTEAVLLAHPRCEVDRLELDLVWSSVLVSIGREVEAAVVAGLVVAAAAGRGERAIEAEAALQRGRALVLTDADLASAALDRAEALFVEIDDPASCSKVLVQQGILAEATGGLAAFVGANQKAYEIARRTGDTRLQSGAAQQLALHAFVEGRPELDRWTAVAEDLHRQDDLAGPARVSLAAAAVAAYSRDDHVAANLSVVARRQGERAGLQHVVVNAVLVELESLVLLGRLEEAQERLVTARAVAETRPSPTMAFNVRLLELALRRRLGDRGAAEAIREELVQVVQAHGAYASADLDERLALDHLESGHFDKASVLATRAMVECQAMGHFFPAVRISLTSVAAAVSGRRRMTLAEATAFRREARERGAPAVEALLARWWVLDDLLNGHVEVAGDLSEAPDLIEARALDFDIAGLRGDRDKLLAAAQEWAILGTNVFSARSLLWHTELTGTPHPEAEEILALLESPPGLAAHLRAQVAGRRD